MNAPVTLNGVLVVLGYIVGIVAGLTAIGMIIKWIIGVYKKTMQWDGYTTRIEALDKKIEDQKTDTDAKLQEINAGLAVLTNSMLAVLEGLTQLNCNGPVTEARDELIRHLNDAAHEQGHH